MNRLRRRPHIHEYAVIGLGRFGSSVALTLENSGYNVLGIDRDTELVQRFADRLTQTVALDSTNENALKEIGITTFDTVVVAIGTDFESNLLTTVALKAIGIERVICKAVTNRQRTILMRVGADQVVLPEVEAGERLAKDLVAPGIRSQVRLLPGYSIVEYPVPHSLVGQTLSEAQLRNRYGVTVLVVNTQEQLQISPAADHVFHEDDVLVLVGANEDLAQFVELG